VSVKNIFSRADCKKFFIDFDQDAE